METKTDMADYYRCMNDIMKVLIKYDESTLRPTQLVIMLESIKHLVATECIDTTK